MARGVKPPTRMPEREKFSIDNLADDVDEWPKSCSAEMHCGHVIDGIVICCECNTYQNPLLEAVHAAMLQEEERAKI